jgi:hypothetical protein
MSYSSKYKKYTYKFGDLANIMDGGAKKNIIILHHPDLKKSSIIPDNLKSIIKILNKIGNVYNYWFKFTQKNFDLDDFLFENVAKDINKTFSHLNKFIIVAIEHACPYGLYYSYHYSKYCSNIVCFPFRFYSKGSLERRIWKLKDNGGYDNTVKKYNVDDYMININNERLQELIKDDSDSGKIAFYYAFDYNLQSQYEKIPTKFKIPTIIYTRLDLDIEGIIEHNYNRKDVAEMKKIFSENDAMQQSMMWNFERVKYDHSLKENNKKNLKIKYIISGWEDYNDIVDDIKIMTN